MISSSTRMHSVSKVKLLVLVDNNPGELGLETAWGLSILVEAPHTRILFDTGPSPKVLLENSHKLGIDLSNIRIVVLSHEHGDHINGLRALDDYVEKIRVYVPYGFNNSFINFIRSRGYKVIIVNDTVEIDEGVYVLKPAYGPPWEHALAINIDGKGLVIVTGCSHPGLDDIVEEAVRALGVKPYIVIGGFHLAGASMDEIKHVVDGLLSLGAEKIYPLHCSGDEIREYLQEVYSEHYGDGGVGLNVVVNDWHGRIGSKQV